MRLSRHLRYGFCLVAPIFFALAGCSQAQEASSNVPQIAQIPPPSTTRLDPPANYVTQKNKVIMLGLIHSGHIESERFGLPVVEKLIRDIDPDYVLTEIPPDRLADAMKGFMETGEVTESRVRVFPEYKDVLFPLSREMDFKIIPTAAWSRGMADFGAQLSQIFAVMKCANPNGTPIRPARNPRARNWETAVMTRISFTQMRMMS